MNNFIISNKLYNYIEALKFKNIDKGILTELKILSDTIISLNFDLNEETFPIFEKYFIEKNYLKRILRDLIYNKKCEEIETTLKEIPSSLIKLTRITGIGKNLANILYKELNIMDIDDLKLAIKEKKLREIKQIGIKGEEIINKNLNIYNKLQKEFSYSYGISVYNFIKEIFKKERLEKFQLVGSLRRKKDVIKNINILISNEELEKILKILKDSNELFIIEKKENFLKFKTIYSEIEIVVNYVPERYFESALLFFTGPRSLNSFLKEKNKKFNFSIDKSGFLKIENYTEKEIFYLFLLPYIPPELRDNWEYFIKFKDNLSIEYNIKGDLHVHTNYSDGISSIYEIVKKARELGYEYIGITDHAEDLKVARGLKKEKIMEERLAIKKIQKVFPDIKILFGVEANIRIDGSIDVEDEVLKELDYTIGSIHFNFNETIETNMKRYIKAMNNPFITIIGHPSGRKIGERKEMDIDWKNFFNEAERTKTILEINSTIDRFDLSPNLSFEANKYNIFFSINSDAHISPQLNYVKNFGLNIAKKAFINEKKIINTYNYKNLLEILKIKREKITSSH